MFDANFCEMNTGSITDHCPCQRQACDASSLLATADDGAY
jgi:hypothetical protein